MNPRFIATALAVLAVGVLLPLSSMGAEQLDDMPDPVKDLLAESLVEPKARLTSTEVLVRELMGRFPLGKARSIDEALLVFLERHHEAFGLSEPRSELTVSKSEKEGDMSRVVFQQIYKGIPVWGRTLIMDINGQGELTVAVSRIGPVSGMKTEPAISGLDAVRTARDQWNKSRSEEFPPCAKELVIYQGALAYNVRVPESGYVFDFFVDAQDGRLVDIKRKEKDASGGCH